MPEKMSADLIERLRGIVRVPITDGMGPAGGEEPDNADFFVRTFPTSPLAMEAAAHIATLQREADGMREALEVAEAWLDRWAEHVGNCRGMYHRDECTCGLTAVRSEARAALNGSPQEASNGDTDA